jgi:predicted MPP superfamily phosphohydrolase
MLGKLRREKYDILVMTGDIVDCDPVRYLENLWGLKELDAPEGVYYCTGNHEYYWGFEKIRKVFEGTKIQVLQNETASLTRGQDQISITGLPDPVSKYFPKARAFSWDEIPPAVLPEYRILLAHQPYLADEAVHKGFQLQLSGHTHAGQFFPWNFLILFFQKYSKGLYRIKKNKGEKGLEDLWLYVNQGTGFWGPPTRLGTYGEITIIELTAVKN